MSLASDAWDKYRNEVAAHEEQNKPFARCDEIYAVSDPIARALLIPAQELASADPTFPGEIITFEHAAWIQLERPLQMEVKSPVTAAIHAVIETDHERPTVRITAVRVATEEKDDELQSNLNDLSSRWAFTFLQFAAQELLTRSRPERAQRRRMVHEMPKETPELYIVNLRARAHAKQTGEAEPQEWNFRWLVRGHWRQQWYPSIKGHAPIWIQPYVKGPDDKPLKPTPQRVFQVSR